jgi:hypothetical protein
MSGDLNGRTTLVGLIIILITFAMSVLTWPRAQREDKPDRAVPALFIVEAACPFPDKATESALRLERRGRLFAERYPYDPEDGIRGAQLLLEAHACYRLAGSDVDIRRTQEFARDLMQRVEADYASARLVLKDALASGHWDVIAGEVHRLLGLTRHLPPGAYVEWLRETAGRANARASMAQ